MKRKVSSAVARRNKAGAHEGGPFLREGPSLHPKPKLTLVPPISERDLGESSFCDDSMRALKLRLNDIVGHTCN